MQNYNSTRNTTNNASTTNADQIQESAFLQRVDVLDLQQAIIANQLVPIVHRTEFRRGVPFSALND